MLQMRKSRSRGHFVFHTGRGAVCVGLRTKLIEVVLQKGFSLAAFIKGNAHAQSEHAADDPIQYIHGLNMGVSPKNIKLEASPC
jgi:hypothetical protein